MLQHISMSNPKNETTESSKIAGVQPRGVDELLRDYIELEEMVLTLAKQTAELREQVRTAKGTREMAPQPQPKKEEQGVRNLGNRPERNHPGGQALHTKITQRIISELPDKPTNDKPHYTPRPVDLAHTALYRQILALLSKEPLRFHEIMERTAGTQNQVTAVLARLQKDRTIVNMGTRHKALWVKITPEITRFLRQRLGQ